MSIPAGRARFFLLASAIVLAAAVGAAQAPAPLPLGKLDNGQVVEGTPVLYQFRAETAGVLSVAVKGGADLALSVIDADGQQIPDGSSDRDLFGSNGTEQMIVTIGEAGTYRVQVRLLDGSSSKFEVGASWIPMASLARPGDPDRRPSLAKELEIGRAQEDQLAADSGDFWDWYVVTPKTGGTLTVVLRPVADSKVDLALELYSAAELAKPIVRSDDDLQGNSANESATIDVTAGQKVYVKVLGATSEPNGRYRLATSLIQ